MTNKEPTEEEWKAFLRYIYDYFNARVIKEPRFPWEESSAQTPLTSETNGLKP